MIDTFWHQYTHKNKNSFTQSDNNVTLPVKSGCFCSNCPQVSLNKTRYMISKKEMKMNRSRKFNWFGWNFFFPSINVTDSSTQSEYFFYRKPNIFDSAVFISLIFTHFHHCCHGEIFIFIWFIQFHSFIHSTHNILTTTRHTRTHGIFSVGQFFPFFDPKITTIISGIWWPPSFFSRKNGKKIQ